MPHELLEKTFVQREKLAERLTQVLSESALRKSKHHILLIGPRGIGKSHLVALVYHRLKNQANVANRLAIAYLREDEWGITSYLDLLIRILRVVEVNPVGHPCEIRVDELAALLPPEAEKKVWDRLHDKLAGRTLLVLIENFASVLRNLGEEGQRKWRSLIQNNTSWALLATSPGLSEEISHHDSPFYGFFEIHHLESLSAAEATALLARLAEVAGDKVIAAFLTTPAGRARVRAVRHLAGGNHRIFLIFFDFLTRQDPEKLVEPLLKTIDALTPYYQSQLEKLSPQQRKLIEFLSENRRPATVKTIASRCFVTHQTAAAQLKHLLEAKYVRVERFGREAYYELAEPLMRICVEVKSHDTQPLSLLVEFLRYWFSRTELEERILGVQTEAIGRTYVEAALRQYDSEDGHAHLSPEISQLCAALTEANRTRDEERVRSAAEELAGISKIAEDGEHYFRACCLLGTITTQRKFIQERLRQTPQDPVFLRALAWVHQAAHQHEEALDALEQVIALNPRSGAVWVDKGNCLLFLSRYAEAVSAFSQALRLRPDWPDVQVAKANALLGLHHPDEALGFLESATKRFPDDARAWRYKGEALFALKRFPEAVAAFERG